MMIKKNRLVSLLRLFCILALTATLTSCGTTGGSVAGGSAAGSSAAEGSYGLSNLLSDFSALVDLFKGSSVSK